MRHQVQDFLPIFLNNPRVILTSIVVTDVTATTIFQEGVVRGPADG